MSGPACQKNIPADVSCTLCYLEHLFWPMLGWTMQSLIYYRMWPTMSGDSKLNWIINDGTKYSTEECTNPVLELTETLWALIWLKVSITMHSRNPHNQILSWNCQQTLSAVKSVPVRDITSCDGVTFIFPQICSLTWFCIHLSHVVSVSL